MNLRFSDYPFQIRKKGDKSLIFDVVRKKYVIITPEEWVRQHFLHYLIQDLNYPRPLISVEMPLMFNNMKKRSDIVVFNRSGNPVLIVECKAPSIKLSEKTFEQIALYNMTLKVKWLVVSNGHNTFCCEINHELKSFSFSESIPAYESLITEPVGLETEANAVT